jgi:hypothetical protein
LSDRIDYWAQVIERWIQDIDQGMGEAAEGAVLADPPDSAPEPTREATPDAG